MFLRRRFTTNIYLATIYQFFIALAMLWLSRFFFVIYNWQSSAVASFGELLRLSAYGLRFDLSAAAYFNVLFIAMRIVPQPLQFNRVWLKASWWVYAVCNSLMLAINIGDTPYYNFTGARLRWSNVATIMTDDGAGSILLHYLPGYWWVVVSGAAFIAVLLWLASRVNVASASRPRIYVRLLLFLVLGGCAFAAMRGRVGAGMPLAIADATYGTRVAPQINVVLNSPYCLLRSMNRKKSNNEPVLTFFTPDELAKIRNSVHIPADTAALRRRNIVTIIIESGGAEWMDSLTLGHTPGSLGLMPFLDSIASQSLVVKNVMATGRTSIGGCTAIFGGFPAFDPFYYMLSPYNKNVVDSPAALLRDKGWATVLYCGVNHGSFNIDQTAHAMGYSRVCDRDAYGNDDDFDGQWGIFDEPMAEYVVDDLSKEPQPFMAAWFTISAHGPFHLPAGYDTSRFRHPEACPERGLEYTDVALRRFFELARRQPWYDNTTFIITGDHGNRDFKGTPYDRDYIRNRVPLIVYTPDGSIAPAVYADRVVSQFDIAPTTLSLVGYDEPYVSVGQDALGNPDNLFGIYRGDGGRYLIADSRRAIYTDSRAEKIEEIYDLASDPFFEHPLSERDSLADALLRRGQAFLQDYTVRLNADSLSVRR